MPNWQKTAARLEVERRAYVRSLICKYALTRQQSEAQQKVTEEFMPYWWNVAKHYYPELYAKAKKQLIEAHTQVFLYANESPAFQELSILVNRHAGVTERLQAHLEQLDHERPWERV